ncbi:hypothetical protein [Ferrimonas lipolytica]|uniref:Lipoprotein n=1 Tax=Ferrimonas lipolytica TaxID=2724191 RepID=A0A6H1UHW7_9GAMM|nr:hypothetical protein [Ferrimonas lipolytica]QIZ78705.1 hypothetical protein HER31_18455 [Ferrimonas lipolytica]
MKCYASLIAALLISGCSNTMTPAEEFHSNALHSQVMLACEDKKEDEACSFGMDQNNQTEGVCISYRRTQMVCHANNIGTLSEAPALQQACSEKTLGDSCEIAKSTGNKAPGTCLVNRDGNLMCADDKHR